MHRRRLIQYEEPVHREVVPPSPASLRPGSSTSKPPAPGPKPKASLPKALKHPAQSKLPVAKGTTTTTEGRLDPKKFPELSWPWRWAYVPSTTTTTNPAANVLVPINHETHAIHPSYYNRFSSAVTDTADPPTNGSARRDLPTRGGFGQLQSISVSESAASTKPSNTIKAANSTAEDKKDLPSREAHLLYGDEFILPYPSIESFEERFNYSFNPSSTSKSQSPIPLRLPREGAPAHSPSHDKDTGASAHLSARMESLRRQACSDKGLNKLLTTTKRRGQSSSDYSNMLSEKIKASAGLQEKARQLYNTTSQKAKDAQESAVTSSARGVAPALFNPTVQNVSAQTASKVIDRRVEEDLRRASPLAAAGRLPTQSTTEETTSAQAASNAKREKWLAIDKPKTPQGDKPREEFVELHLESDEEGWEKVDGDDEWEVIDDPRVEMKQKVNFQSKT